MSNKELLYAASTIWVVVAAVLVIFMQAGFAFLEAGLTRMKNVGHIAAKNVLIFAIASIVYYPDQSLFIIPIPVPIPAPLFALGYVAYSWYSARQARGRINHDAHLGGALFGLLFVAITDPSAFRGLAALLD